MWIVKKLNLVKFAKGIDPIFNKWYKFFNEYILSINEVIIGDRTMTAKLGYVPKWGTRHTKAVEKSLKTKSEPLTILEAIMQI